jgi:hypothetical protein
VLTRRELHTRRSSHMSLGIYALSGRQCADTEGCSLFPKVSTPPHLSVTQSSRMTSIIHKLLNVARNKSFEVSPGG